MKSICIKTNNSDLIQYLLNELNDLELEQVYFSCRKFKHYNNIIIHYKGLDNNLFLNKICSILSLLILDELEETFLKKSCSCHVVVDGAVVYLVLDNTK